MNFKVPNVRSLTPGDVLDIIAETGMGWNHETHTGAVLRLVSGAVPGRIGVTAIDNSAAQASAAFGRFETALAVAAGIQA